jgi:hypothetical protein
VCKTVGDDAFRKLAAEYLRAHPSAYPSTFQVGRFLPGFLRDHRLSTSWPYLGDLARRERVLIDIFHAPDDVPCSENEIRAVPPGKWPLLRVQTITAVAILDSEWPLDEVIDVLSNETTLATPVRRRTSVLVWRQHNEVYRRRLERAERPALGLAEGLRWKRYAKLPPSGLCPTTEQLNQMLRRWLHDGLIRRPTWSLRRCQPLFG